MPEKEPTNVSWLIQGMPIMFAMLWSAFAGAIGYVNRINKRKAAFNLISFIIEISTSGFVGIVAFMLCDAAGFGWSTTAAIVAISGHMGARALALVENLGIHLIYKRFGYDDSKAKTQRTKKTAEDA